ncbi:hypothetical protein [Streptomyces sp. NPDC101237]|uniref:hypothetical protein n=1 Tax=Streptomyces sp. NPDC101237 TaxID=3366139 RepID=UPI003800D40E
MKALVAPEPGVGRADPGMRAMRLAAVAPLIGYVVVVTMFRSTDDAQRGDHGQPSSLSRNKWVLVISGSVLSLGLILGTPFLLNLLARRIWTGDS